MAGKKLQPHRRPLPDGQGHPACAIVNLVVPLAHEATAMRTTDTAATHNGTSGAVSRLSDRLGNVDSTMERSTPPTRRMPGFRASTTATRTTTTRTTTIACAPSAASPDAAFLFEDLVHAYYDCRRTKRTTASALAFELDLEHNLAGLHADLMDGSYRPGQSICFVITRPKPREVWAAAFRDRIVHHLLYNHIGAGIERTFSVDSCACIPGRGTHYAARRLERKVRSQTRNWSRPGYYLKMDIANFFVAIDKHILDRLLATRIQEKWWLWLAHLVLWHDPRKHVEVQGTAADLALIPAHKSLFNQPDHRGLPIGNLSSQFFANVYLDVLDQHVKHRLKVRHYIRYVDDFALLDESAEWLNYARADIEAFLPDQLGIHLNPVKTILQPIDRGIDFVGQVILPWRTVTRRRTVHMAVHRLQTMPAEDVYQAGNSYLGLVRQASRSHHDQVLIANALRRRGHAVNHPLTKTFPST